MWWAFFRILNMPFWYSLCSSWLWKKVPSPREWPHRKEQKVNRPSYNTAVTLTIICYLLDNLVSCVGLITYDSLKRHFITNYWTSKETGHHVILLLFLILFLPGAVKKMLLNTHTSHFPFKTHIMHIYMFLN